VMQDVQFIMYGSPPSGLPPSRELLLRSLESKLQESKSAVVDSEASAHRSQETDLVSRLVLLRREVLVHLIGIARQATATYCQIIGDELETLKDSASCFAAAGNTPQWHDLAHLVVAGLVIDLGILRELLGSGELIEQPDDYWIWAFEGGTGARNAFGVRMWVEDRDGATVAQLWHQGTTRPHDLKLDPADVMLLRELLEGERDPGFLDSKLQQRALRLQFYGLVTKNLNRYVITIPALSGSGAAVAKDRVTLIARQIFLQAVRPAMRLADEIYGRYGVARHDAFRHAFARLLLEHAADAAIERKLIPDFPTEADARWATWFMNESPIGRSRGSVCKTAPQS